MAFLEVGCNNVSYESMMKERRRGEELEEALLEAAWAELNEQGYAGLTMEAVASRAGTSRPVLARRWPTKSALAVAALRLQMGRHPVSVGDMGDIRTELLEFLDLASERARTAIAVFTLFATAYFGETDSSPEDLRRALIDGEANALTDILDRAIQRRQIDAAKLKPPITTLLGDLFRHHALMTYSPPPPDLRMAWVDDVFLPLVRHAN